VGTVFWGDFGKRGNSRTIGTTLTIDQYAYLLKYAPVLVWKANADGLCDYFNDSWLRFRGRTLEQESGEGWAEGVHPADLGECLENRRALFGMRAWFRMKYRLRRHDGVWRWVRDAGVPIYAPDGRFSGFLGTCVEVHESRERKGQEAIPVVSTCSWCHRVKEDDGKWEEMERYVVRHAAINFTHGICPECLREQDPCDE